MMCREQMVETYIPVTTTACFLLKMTIEKLKNIVQTEIFCLLFTRFNFSIEFFNIYHAVVEWRTHDENRPMRILCHVL